MSDFDATKDSTDPELQEFLMIEKQKAQVNAQVWNLLKKILMEFDRKKKLFLDSRV